MISSAEAINLGIAAGNINITHDEKELMEFSEATIEEQLRHAVALQQVEAQRRARALVVPTNDAEVRNSLRALGLPVCYFGEGPGDRRDRLKAELGQRQVEGEDMEGVKRLLAQAGEAVAESSSDEEMEDVKKGEREEFYTPASPALIEARWSIQAFSFKRAATRLANRKRRKEEENNKPIEIIKNLKNMAAVVSQTGNRRAIGCVRFDPTGDFVSTGDWTGLVQVCKTDGTSEGQRSLIGHTERVVACAWHPFSGKSLASSAANLVTAGADSVAVLWSNNNDKPLAKLSGHLGRLACVEWHPSGKYIGTTSYDYSWRLWDVETHSELLLQEGHYREVYGLSFHPDGSLAATGDLGGVGRLWDLRSGQSILTLRGHVGSLLACSFSPNGYHLATGGADNSIKIWDLRLKRNVYSVPAHNRQISDLCYAPNSGTFLVSSSHDQKAKIWDTKNYSLIKTLEAHEKIIMSCDISQDETKIVTSGFDRTFKIWKEEEFGW